MLAARSTALAIRHVGTRSQRPIVRRHTPAPRVAKYSVRPSAERANTLATLFPFVPAPRHLRPSFHGCQFSPAASLIHTPWFWVARYRVLRSWGSTRILRNSWSTLRSCVIGGQCAPPSVDFMTVPWKSGRPLPAFSPFFEQAYMISGSTGSNAIEKTHCSDGQPSSHISQCCPPSSDRFTPL